AAKYLKATFQSLDSLKVKKDGVRNRLSQTNHVLEIARDYARDAEHYLGNRKPVTALACIAYAEGLLDALKFLQLVEF
ncbi:DUF357 domain-containing protein, partial [Candidatus Bathyarchaeota archaeon]